MPSLVEILTSEENKPSVIDACCSVIDQEVADKGGLSGAAIKAGYKAIQGIKPGFVKNVVHDLLPEFASAMDPIFQEAVAHGSPVQAYFETHAGRVADGLLSITDARAERSHNKVAKGGYSKLRGVAKKNVEAAVPRLGALVARFAG